MVAKLNPIHRKATQQSSRQGGFMMIEVLVAVLIFSIGLMGLVALQTTTVQQSADVEYRTKAAALANEIVAQMWIRKTSDPTATGLSADITSWKTKVSSSDLPNASGTVEKDGDITTVIVQYKRPSKTAAENFNRYSTQVVVPQ